MDLFDELDAQLGDLEQVATISPKPDFCPQQTFSPGYPSPNMSPKPNFCQQRTYSPQLNVQSLPPKAHFSPQATQPPQSSLTLSGGRHTSASPSDFHRRSPQPGEHQRVSPQMGGESQSIREEIDKMRKIGLYVKHYVEAGDLAKAKKYYDWVVHYIQKLLEYQKRPDHLIEFDKMIQAAIAEQKPIIASYRSATGQGQKPDLLRAASPDPSASSPRTTTPDRVPMKGRSPTQFSEAQRSVGSNPSLSIGKRPTFRTTQTGAPKRYSDCDSRDRGFSPSPLVNMAHREVKRQRSSTTEVLPVGKQTEKKDSQEEASSRSFDELELTIFRARFPHINHMEDWLAFQAGDLITRVQSPDMDPIPGWEIGINHRTKVMGIFPVAYAEVLDSGVVIDGYAAKTVEKAQMGSKPQEVKKVGFCKEDEDEDEEIAEEKNEKGAAMAPPPAIAEISEENLQRMKTLSLRNSFYGDPGQQIESDVEKKKELGISYDRRASLAVSQVHLKKFIQKELGNDWDTSKQPPHTLSIKKPTNSKEKKKQKNELLALIGHVEANSPEYQKIDLSDILIPYPMMKKLFGSLATNKHLYSLGLRNTGVSTNMLQLFATHLRTNRTLRSLDIRGNGLGMKGAKLMETVVQKNYGLFQVFLFDDIDLQKKAVAQAMENIDWYLQSNRGFASFAKKKSTELRLCGRAINSCEGWEVFTATTFINASFNYLREINPKIGTMLTNLIEVNFSHNDIANIPYSFGQLPNLASLDVSYNQIKEVPSTLDKCSKLKVLNVESNKIRTFPSSVLRLPKLKEVHAQQNKLKPPLPANADPMGSIEILLKKNCRN